MQLALILYAQFTPRRYFCWAPNDYANSFSLRVKVDGKDLSSDQALARYHLQDLRYSYENPATHITDLVTQYEETYGRNDHAQVIMLWSFNGHSTQTWRWPPE